MNSVDHDLLHLVRARPYTSVIVARLYVVALGRAPDLAGLADFSARLNRGESLQSISRAVIDSDEFRMLHGSAELEAALYRNATGRDLAVDNPHIISLIASLARHGRLPVRDDAEFLAWQATQDGTDINPRAVIGQLYQVAYGRSPDAGGYHHFLALLEAGEPVESIVDSFICAPEFQDRNGDRPTAAQIYRNAVAPSEEHEGLPEEFLAGLISWVGPYDGVNALAALFPQGIPVSEPGGYDLWLRDATVRKKTCLGAGQASRDARGISWIIILARPMLGRLRSLVASIVQQTGRWQLIIAWSGRESADVQRYLSALLIQHASIILVRGDGRSEAALFGAALRQARQTHTCLIGQHDELAGGANAVLSLASEDADILIGDEDEIGGDGEWSAPHMGTSWDPEAAACIERRGLVVYPTELLLDIGGMRARHALFGEIDLLLRAASRVKEHAIRHVARVLCHRYGRVYGHAFSTRHLDYLEEYLRKFAGHGGVAARSRDGRLLVRYPLPAPAPLVSIIIPTRDMAGYLDACVRSILSLTSYESFEILIIDNDSVETATKNLLHQLSKLRGIRVIPCGGGFNWSYLNNSAVLHMRGEVAVFLNNDTEIRDPDWLTELVEQASRPEIGAVGAKLLYPDDTIQHAGIALGPNGRSTHVWRHAKSGDPGYLEQLRSVRRVGAVTGACLATRRSVFEAVGGFESQHLKVTWSDVDYCLRVRELGLHVLWTPHATLIHHEQATRGPDTTAEAAARLSAEQDYMRHRWGPGWMPIRTGARICGLAARNRAFHLVLVSSVRSVLQHYRDPWSLGGEEHREHCAGLLHRARSGGGLPSAE